MLRGDKVQASVFYEKCNDIIDEQNGVAKKLDAFDDIFSTGIVLDENAEQNGLGTSELLLGESILEETDGLLPSASEMPKADSLNDKYEASTINDRILTDSDIPTLDVDKYITEFSDVNLSALESIIIETIHNFGYEFIQGNSAADVIQNSLSKVYNMDFRDDIFASFVFCLDVFNIDMDYPDFSSITKFLNRKMLQNIGRRNTKFTFQMFQAFQELSNEPWFQSDMFLQLVTDENAEILVSAMKGRKDLTDVLKYDGDNALCALKLIEKDKYNPVSFLEAVKSNAVKEYTENMLDNSVSSTIAKLALRNDYQQLNSIISENNIPDDILVRYTDSEFLLDILHLYLDGKYSESLIDICIKEENALVRILLSSVESDHFDFNLYNKVQNVFMSCIIVNMKDYGIVTDGIIHAFNQMPDKCIKVAESLLKALAYSKITVSDYKQYLLLYSLSFVTAYTEILERKFSEGSLSFNAFWLTYFASKLQDRLSRNGITLNTEDFRVNCSSMILVNKDNSFEISVEDIIINCNSVLSKISGMIDNCNVVKTELGAQLIVYLTDSKLNVSFTKHRMMGPLEYWAQSRDVTSNNFVEVIKMPVKRFVKEYKITKTVKELCNNSIKQLVGLSRQIIYFQNEWKNTFGKLMYTKNYLIYINASYIAKSFSPGNDSQMLYCLLYVICKLILKGKFATGETKLSSLSSNCTIIVKNGRNAIKTDVKTFIEDFEKNLEILLGGKVTISCNSSISISIN